MTYPKINKIWKRDPNNKNQIIEGDYTCPEFDAVKKWSVTEKVDGCCIRVCYEFQVDGTFPVVLFGGKTDNAQIPAKLANYLKDKFTVELFKQTFPDANEVMLFGEGYGGYIQSAGKNYIPEPSFILFDVYLDGYWLERPNVEDVAKKLGIECVPSFGIMTTEEAIGFLKKIQFSLVARKNSVETPIEGIVARSEPLMLFRKNKTPIMWKLKVRDYV